MYLIPRREGKQCSKGRKFCLQIIQGDLGKFLLNPIYNLGGVLRI